MFKKILIALIALVVAFCAYVAMQPAEMRVARSTTISAPSDVIFPHINSLKKFNAWSPWAKVDPNASITFEGADQGVGAVSKWKGNQEVGEGSMTIVEAAPSKFVRMKLDFIEPWPGQADVDFTFEPAGTATKVTWAMTSQHGFFDRAMCILLQMNPEKMIGDKYAEGLATLKKTVETGDARSS